MSTLIAIGYPDETTATAAGDEAQQLAKDLLIQPDAIAVIRRDVNGHFHVTTNHHAVAGGTTYGMFWGLLFGLLFFIPVFGMAVGAGLGALMGKMAKTGIDKQFQEQVRDMLQPGHLGTVPRGGEGHAGPGHRRHEQVRRDGPEVVAVQGRRRGAAEGAAAATRQSPPADPRLGCAGPHGRWSVGPGFFLHACAAAYRYP